jgi:AcrR family transcriptional regulator
MCKSMPGSTPTARPPRRARTPDGEARGAILAATERLLAERPLHELSVIDIAERAGTSRGIFYFYFAGKSAVLAALAESVCAELIAIWRPWFEGEGGIDEAEFAKNFTQSVQLWADHRAILSGVVENWRMDPEVSAVWSTLMNTLIGHTRDRIERDRAAGRPIVEGDAAALAETLIWATERIHYVALAGIAPALSERSTMIERLASFWARTLAPASPPMRGS